MAAMTRDPTHAWHGMARQGKACRGFGKY